MEKLFCQIVFCGRCEQRNEMRRWDAKFCVCTIFYFNFAQNYKYAFQQGKI